MKKVRIGYHALYEQFLLSGVTVMSFGAEGAGFQESLIFVRGVNNRVKW